MKKMYHSALAVALLAGSTLADPQEEQTFAGPYNIYADFNPDNPSIDVTFTGGGYTAIGWRLLFDLQAVAPGTTINEVDIIVTPPGGEPKYYNLDGFYYTNQTNLGGIYDLPAGIDGPGTWNIMFSESNQNGPDGGVESIISNVRFALISAEAAPTPDQTIDPVPAGATSATVTLGMGEIKWIKFVTTTEASTATGTFLDIATQSGGSRNDPEIAVYTEVGSRVAQDDNGGPGFLSLLSFGPPAPGTFGAGTLPAGTYYLAVGLQNSTFNPGFGATSTSRDSGDVELTFTQGSFASSPPGTIPTPLVTFDPLPDGLTNTTLTGFVNERGSQVKWVKFTTGLEASLATNRFVDIRTTTGGNTVIGLYNSAGSLVAQNDDLGYEIEDISGLSLLSFGTGAGRGGAAGADGMLLAGTYYLAVARSNTRFNPGFDVATIDTRLEDIDVQLDQGVYSAPAAPAVAATFDPLPAGDIAGAVSVGPGEVKWVKFVTTADATDEADKYIDIFTVARKDTEIGLYNNTGARIARNDDDGSGQFFSALSFGTGANGISGTAPFNGMNGPLVAGTYYLSLSLHNTSFFARGWDVISTSTDSDTIGFLISSGDFPSNPPTPPVSLDLGTFGAAGQTENVQSTIWTMASAQEVKWFKLTTTVAALASENFVDIDTEGTDPTSPADVGSLADTLLGVYNASGTLRTRDDDDGFDLRSAISYGDNVNIRPAVVTGGEPGEPWPRNGRDGNLPAGTYYIFVATYLPATTYRFNVTPDPLRTTVGDRVLTVRTNFALPVSNACPNPSNVSGPGQNTAAIDEELTADDIIVFLNRFFAGDPLSNVSGPGQNTTQIDNELTADDIIVFLNRFFAGC